jgi:hypothetical protein
MKHFKPNVIVTDLYVPRWILPLKGIAWSAKTLLGLIHNMDERQINLFKSFSPKEIAEFAGMSYNTVITGRQSLIEQGFISEEGEVLRNG